MGFFKQLEIERCEAAEKGDPHDDVVPGNPCPPSMVVLATRGGDRLLLTERDAARLLAISPSKLYQMERAREIPAVRFSGRRKAYDRRDLLEWIDRAKKARRPERQPAAAQPRNDDGTFQPQSGRRRKKRVDFKTT
jgi:excisionase family DNA binding protein